MYFVCCYSSILNFGYFDAKSIAFHTELAMVPLELVVFVDRYCWSKKHFPHWCLRQERQLCLFLIMFIPSHHQPLITKKVQITIRRKNISYSNLFSEGCVKTKKVHILMHIFRYVIIPQNFVNENPIHLYFV